MRPDDVSLTITERIVSAGTGLLQRVLVIGSRARGSARPDSDLDMLVIVDPCTGDWRARDNVAERRRLQRKIGQTPVALDLWVRTIDQFAEACDVIGGVEQVAASCAIETYRRPPVRAPLVRRSPHQVRLQHVADWLDDSYRLLGQAIRGETPYARALEKRGVQKPAEYYATRSIHHSLGAVFVWQSIEPPQKDDGLQVWWEALSGLDAHAVSSIAAGAGEAPATANSATVLLRRTVRHLRKNEELRERLLQLSDRVSGPMSEIALAPALKG